MAIISFDKNTFEKEIGKLNEEMKNKIAMFGTPIEEINSNEIYIEIFPNRPDLLSYSGFKRAFLSFLGKKTGLKEYKLYPPEKNYEVIIDHSVKEIRPYTACAIVRGLKFNDERIKEIIEMQEKLHITLGRKRRKVAIGIYPLDKIELPITFKAIEPDQIKFIPLETEKELSGLEILQKHPTGKEYAHLLAGKMKFPIFVDSKDKILSMPPIINSKETGKITTDTKDIFIECSGFDFEILKNCLNIIVTGFAEMGGKIYQMNLRYKRKEITPQLSPKEIKISLENVNRILGLNLNEKEIKKLIEKMGHNYEKGNVKFASWRTDILHEIDIIEDIAIAYGYENFIPEIPKISGIGKELEEEPIKRKIGEILSGIGLIEVSNYHLTNKKDQTEKMLLSEKNINLIEVENSKTEYSFLRKSLTPLLLRNFSENIDSEYPQEIFEIGNIFSDDKTNKKILEKKHLSCGTSPGNYTRIKQIAEYLFKNISIENEIKFKEPEKSDGLPIHYIEGRTAEIIFQNKRIGFIGEIHPKTLRNWKIKMPIALFEMEIEEILNFIQNNP